MGITDANSGIDWPEFDDGSGYVSIGNEFVTYDLSVREVVSIEFEKDEFTIWDDHGQPNTYPYGHKVKRGVVDADDRPVSLGDTVWTIKEPTHKYMVVDHTGFGVLLEDDDRHRECCEARELTHECPLFGADHKRLKVGDEVYDTVRGVEYTVSYVKDGKVKAKSKSDGKEVVMLHKQLAHGKPALGSDKLPILEGETVYGVNSGDKYEAVNVENGKVITQNEDGFITSTAPNLLTHKLIGHDGKFIEVGDTVYSVISGTKMEVVATNKNLAYTTDPIVGNIGYPGKWLTHENKNGDSEEDAYSWESVWYDVKHNGMSIDEMERRCKKLAGADE